jgi:Na+-driven multidrug efflux pump
MIGVGGNTRIAILLGNGKVRRSSQVLGLILLLGALLGVAGSLSAFFLMPQILGILGAESTQLGIFAGDYLRGLIPFFSFMILIFILEQSIRNDGQPHFASIVMAACAVLNIVLDYFFLFVMNYGIIGAAMATGISQSCGAILFLSYFAFKYLKKKNGLQLAIPVLNFEILKTIVINGSSEMLNSFAAGITIFLYNKSILFHSGELGVAAFAMSQYILMMGMMIIVGISNGTQPIFSYNHGADKNQRVKGALWRVASICFFTGLAFFLIIGWKVDYMAGLFLRGHDDALVLSIEVTSIVRWSLIFMPLAVLGSVFFTALEQAGKSLIVALSRGLIFPVLGLILLPLWWGAFGIWFTVIFSESISVLVAISCYLWHKKPASCKTVLSPEVDVSLVVYN